MMHTTLILVLLSAVNFADASVYPDERCLDWLVNCREMATKGSCVTEKKFMKSNCCESCKLYNTTAAPSITSNKTKVTQQLPSELPPTESCVDWLSDCTKMAKAGSCITQKKFMEDNCCQACKSYGYTGGFYPDERCLDWLVYCETMAKNGSCRSRKNFMERSCCKSCKLYNHTATALPTTNNPSATQEPQTTALPTKNNPSATQEPQISREIAGTWGNKKGVLTFYVDSDNQMKELKGLYCYRSGKYNVYGSFGKSFPTTIGFTVTMEGDHVSETTTISWSGEYQLDYDGPVIVTSWVLTRLVNPDSLESANEHGQDIFTRLEEDNCSYDN